MLFKKLAKGCRSVAVISDVSLIRTDLTHPLKNMISIFGEIIEWKKIGHEKRDHIRIQLNPLFNLFFVSALLANKSSMIK